MRRLILLTYPGGKGRQVDDLLPYLPRTHTFVEVFGGGASVLLNREPSPVEVYNDLNSSLVTLFRVVRDPVLYEEFVHRLGNTLWARDEYIEAHRLIYEEDNPSEMDTAWAYFVIHNMGFSGRHGKGGNWSRGKENAQPVERWWRRIEMLPVIRDRLRLVQIDNLDVIDCLNYWDSPETLFYLDPPYVMSTRNDKKYYRFEMDDEKHEAMVDTLRNIQGYAVMSGYDSPIYQPLVDDGWVMHRYEATMTSTPGLDQSLRRVEVIWRNPRAALAAGQGALF